MKLDPTKYVEGTRKLLDLPSNVNKLEASGGLTVAQTFAFLLFLQAKTAEIEKIYARAVEKDKTGALAQVRKDLDRYESNLQVYEEYLLGFMEQGYDNRELSLPVERPLFYGYFGKDTPLCGGPDPSLLGDCTASAPEVAMPIIILNELSEYVDFREDNWQDFIENASRDAARVGLAVAFPPSAAKALEDETNKILDWAEDKAISAAGGRPKNRTGDSPFEKWKWAAYGVGAGVGLLGLYKLLK